LITTSSRSKTTIFIHSLHFAY